MQNAKTDIWQTQDEVAFIVGLGTHRNGSAYEPLADRTEHLSRKALLKNYIQAAVKRDRWDGINKRTCLEVAASLLVEE